MPTDNKPVKGRGASGDPENRFLSRQYAVLHPEGVDAMEEEVHPTKYVEVFPRTIVNEVRSPDVPFRWSMNPYQGCEHGCSYCYARTTHEYWGYSAGLDFERTILIKRNAPQLLDATLRKPRWVVDPITLSGATDPYQPIERKEQLTRKLLEVLQAFRHPVGIITKNALVLRDIDILAELARQRLASVAISLTTFDEVLRRNMEPRTSTAANRLEAIRTLSGAGIPVHVMVAPIIPGLNDHEVPALLKAAAEAGARSVGYTLLRTNGSVQDVFEKWLHDHVPDRAAKVMALTREVHGGAMSDNRIGTRMRGEGAYANSIARLFTVMRSRYFAGRSVPAYDLTRFERPAHGQLDLFR